MSLESILSDLDQLANALKLDNGLGDQLLDIATEAMRAGFDSQSDPSGAAWEPLSSDYAKAKARKYPGAPIGVRTGLMRSGLDDGQGVRSVTPAAAEWTFGSTETQQDEAQWFQDPPSSRPDRKFVGLSADAQANVDATIIRHIRESL